MPMLQILRAPWNLPSCREVSAVLLQGQEHCQFQLYKR